MSDPPLSSVTRRVVVKSRGKVLGLAREHYLRRDLPCRAELCFEGCNDRSKPVLRADTSTHYLVPMEDVAAGFLDVLDLPEVKSAILQISVKCQ